MPRHRHLTGRIVKFLFGLLIFAIAAILIWRMVFSDRIPRSIATIAVNEQTKAAYDLYGDDLILRYQEQASVTKADNNYGYFGIASCVFIPQANQVQIVFRYNNSTLKHLAVDYGLDEIPDRSEDFFDVTLVRTTDLTPDNPDDNNEEGKFVEERFFPTSSKKDTTRLYTFYRFVFDGVTVDDDTLGVFADVYYVEDLDYANPPYGTLCLFDWESEWLPYKLTGDDKRALEE